jgi:hypothetical protein
VQQKNLFYIDNLGARRLNGIYCPVFDRFLLIDDWDYWITLETAKVLSSKVASVVYILPSKMGALTDRNCLNFGIFNKRNQKRFGSTDLVRGQIPSIKIFPGTWRELIDYGMPEDYKTDYGIKTLFKLKEFADTTQKYMYAAKISNEMSSGFFDNKTFTDDIISDNLISNIDNYHNKDGSEMSYLKTIKNIFYMANTIEEATEKTTEFFEVTEWIPPPQKEMFYKILDNVNV